MANPTQALNIPANKGYKVDNTSVEAVIKEGEQLVVYGFACIKAETQEMEFAKGGAGFIPAGLVMGPSDGGMPPAALLGDTARKAVARGGFVIQWPVVGATAKTDIGKSVYPVDGQTLTLTPGTKPSGIVLDWHGSTMCSVYVFSFLEQCKMGILLETVQTLIEPLLEP